MAQSQYPLGGQLHFDKFGLRGIANAFLSQYPLGGQLHFDLAVNTLYTNNKKSQYPLGGQLHFDSTFNRKIVTIILSHDFCNH